MRPFNLEVMLCYGQTFVYAQNSYVKSLTRYITVFRDETFKKVNKMKWGHKGGH
jgi:hypothetical protein